MDKLNVDELFRSRAHHLRQVVRRDVAISHATVEDACQSAWERLLGAHERVRAESAFGWLATTAIREARAEAALALRGVSLDALIGDGSDGTGAVGAETSFATGADARERLRALACLPLRQRRLMWLQGLGLSYREMAEHEACTRRTVERQLLRARRRLEQV